VLGPCWATQALPEGHWEGWEQGRAALLRAMGQQRLVSPDDAGAPARSTSTLPRWSQLASLARLCGLAAVRGNKRPRLSQP